MLTRWHLAIAIASIVVASPRNNIFKQPWCYAACVSCRPITHDEDDLQVNTREMYFNYWAKKNNYTTEYQDFSL